MELLLVLLLVLLLALGLLAAATRGRHLYSALTELSALLDVSHRMAQQDATRLRQEVQQRATAVRLGRDDRAREELTAAQEGLTAAETALAQKPTRRSLLAALEAMEAARHALARTTARLTGGPGPDHGTPCYFDPAHGPATQHLPWTEPGRGTRTVAACSLDAAAVQRGDRPTVRRLAYDGVRVPWSSAPELLLLSPWQDVLRPRPVRNADDAVIDAPVDRTRDTYGDTSVESHTRKRYDRDLDRPG